jgi:hypothetical protein
MTQYGIKPAPDLMISTDCRFIVSRNGVKVIVVDEWAFLDASEALALREWLDGVLESSREA